MNRRSLFKALLAAPLALVAAPLLKVFGKKDNAVWKGTIGDVHGYQWTDADPMHYRVVATGELIEAENVARFISNGVSPVEPGYLVWRNLGCGATAGKTYLASELEPVWKYTVE